MKYTLNLGAKDFSSDSLVLVSAFEKTVEAKGKTKESKAIVNTHWSKELKTAFENIKTSADFTGSLDSTFTFHLENGTTILAYGLGEKKSMDFEALRNSAAKIYKSIASKHKEVAVQFDGFTLKNKAEESLNAMAEGLSLADYKFDRHFVKKSPAKLKEITFDSAAKKTGLKKLQKTLDDTLVVTESINVGRNFVNEAPNILRSTTYAKEVLADIKGTKGVKTKVLGKAELKKEKMGLFLSVNSGSGYEPQLVHLTYTPAKMTKKTKHIALVGKGLVFDTGGYSLKPSGSMVNMKFDMAGSATVYSAFRAVAKLGLNVKVTCILGMTDNAVNEFATMPDAIVKARNGLSVEILNTDAEGRLVLADCLDYACDQKPDAIIDSATLTGAVLVSLGNQVCGVMGTDQKLTDSLLKSAKNTDEYMWQLPIIKEFHEDMKSPVADLKNIGGSSFGGSSKAAAFLSNFVRDGIPWAHLDIAGIGDSQGHKAYCPTKGASGLIVRTLVDFLKNS
ncbi:leucyl aminopeptidase [Halobacteriovorax marinus]|uniref:leucyl aminopeptidase n=1 Tax=Halobacteriovorax marinus TaxID=97084 RepID=UPI000BC2FDEA|nr:leucyl aminopeptidase [Halobacteriovorax marinus]ATH09024.1 leucyl aminopeptidase [Halobacteriovorax marinus]